MNKRRFKLLSIVRWRSRTAPTTLPLKHTVILKKRADIRAKRKRSVNFFDKIKQKFIAIETLPFFLIINVFVKLKNVLFMIAFLIILGVFVRWLLDPHTLPISAYISGNQQVSTVELQKIMAPYLTGGFFYINLSAIQRAILTIPWVKQVKIQRLFPDSLFVKIEEYQPVAFWNDDTLLDAQGDVFVGVKPTQSLPLLTAPTTVTAKTVLAHYQQLQPLLRAKNLQIQQFGCNTRQAWFMILENNIHLLLGRDNIRARLQRFMKVYDQFKSSVFSLCEQHSITCLQPGNRNFIRIDLRYTNGMAVRLIKAE